MAGGPVAAAEEDSSTGELSLPLLQREQLTGDWWGLRSRAADHGITTAPYLILDFSKNTRGGLDTEGSALRALLSINVTLDMTKLAGWPSGKFFLDAHFQDGQYGSDEVGDYQGVGSWDADGLAQISELWFEYAFFDGKLRAKVGKVDANYEFAYSELGFEFVHGSAGYPATAMPLPTYPDPATSLNLFWSPTEWFTLGGGIYDGAGQEGYRTGRRGPDTFFGDPADLFLIAEAGLNWQLGSQALPGRFTVGGWHHTGTFARYDGGIDKGTSGFSLVVDQMLWLAEASTEETLAEFTSPGIGVFLQYDWADPMVMPADHHIAAGATWRGPIPGRQTDLLGVMVSWVHFSDEPAAGFTDSSELATELMYQARITPAVIVQPYVQYIINPGGASLDDAINVGVRLTINF